MSRRFRRIALLKGGMSAEREISLVSGENCARALNEAGYDVTEIDAGPDLPQRLADIRPDAVFNALHGRWGEDGAVQGLLEWLAIPYTHSGVFASALAMDKARAKACFVQGGLRTPESLLIASDALAGRHPMALPYVVKPVNEGSSIDVAILREGDAPLSCEALSRERPGRKADARLMAERYIPGHELTVAVMGERALAVTDIRATGGRFYDYHAKYAEGGSVHSIPAKIPESVTREALDMALEAHRLLGCRGVSRADFRYDPHDAQGEGLYILEVNTQPGMTPASLVPEQAAHLGIAFADLVIWMMEDASCER